MPPLLPLVFLFCTLNGGDEWYLFELGKRFGKTEKNRLFRDGEKHVSSLQQDLRVWNR
jgi:hypothetical protein